MNRKESKRVKYLAACPHGICKLGIKEIVRVNPTKTAPGYRKCKKHGGLVIAAEIICDTCGEPFQIRLQQASTKTCWKCKDKRKEEILEWKAAKKARGIAKKQAIKDAAIKRKLAIKAKKKQKLKPKKPVWKPVVPVKGSYHKFGDYCSNVVACNREGQLMCDTCTKFTGAFFGHDPRPLGLWT